MRRIYLLRREVNSDPASITKMQMEDVMSTIGSSASKPSTPLAKNALEPEAPPTTPYGAPISLDTGRRVMAAAEAEALKNRWDVVVAIVDSGGHLKMLHRTDNTQIASIRLAIGKARASAEFRRPTRALEDAAGCEGGLGLRYLTLGAETIAEGGIPIVVDGRIVGAVGVSGVASHQDAQVATAGARAAREQ